MTAISVIVTCFNYDRYVCSAVHSALAQTHAPCEVIVVDDGSTDQSWRLLHESFATVPSVRLVQQVNAGQLAAFRTAAHLVKGEVVALLDADDYWDCDYLKEINSVFALHLSADFIICPVKTFGESEGFVGVPQGYGPGGLDYGLTSVIVGMSDEPPWLGVPTSGISVRLRHLRRILELPASYDADWRVEADFAIATGSSVLAGHKRALSTALVNYRLHSNNSWFGKQKSSVDIARRQWQRDRLLQWYRFRSWGNSRPTARFVCFEFKTKAQPSFSDLCRYALFIARSDGSLMARSTQMLLILKHWCKSNFKETR